MLIIINTAPRGKKDLVKSYGECMNCGFEGELQSYTSRMWVYLLYLIPISPSVKAHRYLNMCPACQQGIVVPTGKLATFTKETFADAKNAAAALIAGKTQVTRNGEDVDALALLGFTLGVLRGAQDIAAVKTIIASLDEKAPPATAALAKGQYQTLKGEPQRALELYKTTLGACPDDADLLTALGRACLISGDAASAKTHLEHLLATTTDTVKTREPMLLLADTYDRLGDYGKMVEMYERCQQAYPEFRENKTFQTAYANAKTKRDNP